MVKYLALKQLDRQLNFHSKHSVILTCSVSKCLQGSTFALLDELERHIVHHSGHQSLYNEMEISDDRPNKINSCD